MKAPVPGWLPTTTKTFVHIPTSDGNAVLKTLEIEVPGWKNADGEIFLDDRAREVAEALKARELGLLTPAQLRDLRDKFGVSQKEISDLLQLGAKTWTRWETGRERPSRSMNILLRALSDGRLDLHYLRCLQPSVAAKIVQFRPEVPPASRQHLRTWTENQTVLSGESRNLASR
ncbi:MAG: helix-turn-helix domain-containing protein [Verrucomicrobiota bacterium]